MRKLTVYDQITLDGRFTDADGDMSWAHKSDPEWNDYVNANAAGGGVLVFGRRTYEMMASYWPTPMAKKNAPLVAERMNALPKVVFSRTLTAATWSNTTLAKRELTEEVRALKSQEGPPLVVMGSGTLVTQLSDARLVDEYTLIVNPIVLGKGRSPFDGLAQRLPLKLATTRAFENGNVALTYAAVR